MKLKVFDVIELKDATKGIVVETTSNKCKMKKVDTSEQIISVNNEDIKKIIFRK